MGIWSVWFNLIASIGSALAALHDLSHTPVAHTVKVPVASHPHPVEHPHRNAGGFHV